MDLLMDTHTFIWFIQDNPLLGIKAKTLLMDGTNDRWLSIVSIWEMAIKVQTGKLVFPKPFRTFISEQLSLNKIRVLPLEFEQACSVCDLEYATDPEGKKHKDPFDRMIVAQSKLAGFPLLSNEQIFEHYGVVRIW